MNLDKVNQRYKETLQCADIVSIRHSIADIPELIAEIKRWRMEFYNRCDIQPNKLRKDGMTVAAKRCIELANDCAAGYEVVAAIEREFKL